MHLRITVPETMYTIKYRNTGDVLRENINWKEVLSFFEEKVFEEVPSPSHFEVKEIGLRSEVICMVQPMRLKTLLSRSMTY